jgi:hypothetical protein
MGMMDGITNAFKAEPIDPKVCKAPSGESYTESDIKNMSTRQLKGLMFSSGFVGDAQSKNCIDLVHKLRGYESTK